MSSQTEPLRTSDVAGAAMQLFAVSPDLVGVVEAEPPHRVLYLNATAEKYAVPAPGGVLGRPLAKAFRRASSGPLLGIVAEAARGRAQSLRGVVTRPGSVWNLDAVPSGSVVLLTGRPLEVGSVTSRRLELLLSSTDAIWRNADGSSLASAIVRSAVELIPGTASSLSVLREPDDRELVIIAGSEDWLCVDTRVALAGSYSGEALKSGVPVEGPPGDADESHRDPLVAAGVRVMRVVPLLRGATDDAGIALGVLSFMSTSVAAFDEDERRLMDEFGKRASVALDRAGLIERERTKAERHRAAFDSALALSSSLSPRAVIDELLQRVVTSIEADRATLSTIDDDRITIEATYSRGGESATWIGRSYGSGMILGQPLIREAVESLRPVIGGRLDPAEAAPELQSGLSIASHTATLPLIRGGTAAGLLVVTRYADPPFSADEVDTLNLIGHAAILSLRNARLHAQALDARNEAQVLARSLQVATETAIDLVQQLDLDDVTDRLLRRALELSGADRAVLASVEGDDVVVLRELTRDGPALLPPSERLRLSDQPLIKQALDTGVAHQSREVAIEQIPGRYREHLGRLGSFATVPLRLGGEAAGILNLSRRREEPFSDQQLQALTLVGQVAVLAMRNARLFEELRKASSAKSEFLNMAAHELRTPIAVVRGYLSLLADGSYGAPPEAWAGPLRILEAKLRDLADISEELVTAARLQLGAAPARAERFDLVAVVREAVEGAAAAAELSGGSVRLDSAPAHLPVHADPGQIRRVLDNLLVNAITYSAAPADVIVTAARRSHVALVTVTDRGRGIPVEKWEAVFEQFERIEDPADPVSGTGLGLYLARGLARANGGDVRIVRSDPGAGSEFELRLPASG